MPSLELVHDDLVLMDRLRELKASEDYAKPYFERAKQHYKTFKMVNDDVDWPFANKVFTADTSKYVLDAIAKIYTTLFGETPIFAWRERYGDGASKLTENLEQLTNWMIDFSGDDFTEEQYDTTFNKAVFGLGYLGVFPMYDKFKGKDVCIGGRFFAPDFWDVLPSWRAYRAKVARHMWHREWLHIDEIAEKFESGYFTGDFDQVLGSNGQPYDSKWHTELLQEIGMEDWIPDEDSNMVEVWNRYANGEVESILNRSYIGRNTAITAPGYLPFDHPWTDTRYIKLPKEWFGMGIPELLQFLQLDKNLLRSQHRENLDMIMNAVIKARRGAGIDIDMLEWYPGAVWMLSDLDDVQVEQMQDAMSGIVLNLEAKLEMEMEDLSGQPRYSRGMTPPHGRETATTVARLQQAGLTRMDMQVRMTEMSQIRDLGWKLALLAKDKMHDDIFEKITRGKTKDQVFEQTDDFDLKYLVDAQPMGARITAVKELKADQMMQLFQMASQIDPALTANDPNPYRISLRSIMEVMLKAQGLHEDIIEKTLPLVQGGPGGGMVDGKAKAVPPGTLNNPQDLAMFAEALQGGGPQ